jgi:hypothetical protein
MNIDNKPFEAVSGVVPSHATALPPTPVSVSLLKRLTSRLNQKPAISYPRQRDQTSRYRESRESRRKKARVAQRERILASKLASGDASAFCLSEVAEGKSRINPVRDRQLLTGLQAELENGGDLLALPLRGRAVVVPPLPHPCIFKEAHLDRKHIEKGLKETRKTKPVIQVYECPSDFPLVTVRLGAWDHLSGYLKSTFYACAMAPERRFAFTLHLSPDVLEAALRASRGFCAFLEEKIAYELRTALPGHLVPFLFWIEGAVLDDGEVEELHLHGAFEVPGVVRNTEGLEVRSEERPFLDIIRVALRRAGGEFEPGSKARQLNTKIMWGPVGWLSYAGKHRNCTLEALQHHRRVRGLPQRSHDGVVGATEDIRARGKALFVQMQTTGETVRCFPRPRNQ